MRRLILVRHGQSEWNAEGRVQGQSGTGLSERGVRQAVATAEEITRHHPSALLYASDQPRAVETVAPVEQALGRLATRDSRLRERSFGTWEGRLRDEVIATDSDRWGRWCDGEDVIAEIGGESSTQVADRTEQVMHEILARTGEGQDAVVVTHGGVIWHGVHRLIGLPNPTLGGVQNSSITVLVDYEHDGVLRLGSWNATGHLPFELRSS